MKFMALSVCIIETRMGRVYNKNFWWTLIAILCGVGLFVILFSAYLNGIPSFISIVPYYDKVGHFFLFGICGYTFHRASKRKYVAIFPMAITLFTVFTVLEEYLQTFSNNRTFSLTDLFFSLLGIWVFFFADYVLNKSKGSRLE